MWSNVELRTVNSGLLVPTDRIILPFDRSPGSSEDEKFLTGELHPSTLQAYVALWVAVGEKFNPRLYTHRGREEFSKTRNDDQIDLIDRYRPHLFSEYIGISGLPNSTVSFALIKAIGENGSHPAFERSVDGKRVKRAREEH